MHGNKRAKGVMAAGMAAACAAVAAAGLLCMNAAAKRLRKENEKSARALQEVLDEGVNDLEFFYGKDSSGETGEYHELVKNRAFSEYAVYYPKALSQAYPVVVWGNGTGGTYRDYEAALKSLASYGFVVIGNDSENNGSGREIYEAGLYAESLNSRTGSIFYGRLDTARIGAGGHSQGACGAVGAITKYERSHTLFSSVFLASMPKAEMCTGRFGYWACDTSLIRVPCFFVSGAGNFDSWIAPSASVEKYYMDVPDGVPAVMAVMTAADHNIVNKFHACGYMNAWFSWTLKGDRKAEKVFTPGGELFRNMVRWQDVQARTALQK